MDLYEFIPQSLEIMPFCLRTEFLIYRKWAVVISFINFGASKFRPDTWWPFLKWIAIRVTLIKFK